MAMGGERKKAGIAKNIGVALADVAKVHRGKKFGWEAWTRTRIVRFRI